MGEIKTRIGKRHSARVARKDQGSFLTGAFLSFCSPWTCHHDDGFGSGSRADDRKDIMSLKTITLAVLAGATLLSAIPAGAQYYDPYRPRYEYDRPPPPRYDDGYRRPPRYDDGYRRPPPPDDYRYGPPRGPRGGGMCVTSRGSCPTPPIPRGAPCRCDIPGFGEKRGIVQ
ncbi:hypothetical protein SAMN05880592_101896 [Bosea sp. TND4EK4]|nr:hypothetical protein SAMN05880592_101896 [Bosea sp. TND4EK4]